jgi:hypothetical protein
MLAFPCHAAVTAGISKGDVGWWDVDGLGVHAGKRFRGGGIRGTTSFKGIRGSFTEDHVTYSTMSSKHLLQIPRTTWWVGNRK